MQRFRRPPAAPRAAYFFLFATVRALPLRVRAFVFVRWPCTGRFCTATPQTFYS